MAFCIILVFVLQIQIKWLTKLYNFKIVRSTLDFIYACFYLMLVLLLFGNFIIVLFTILPYLFVETLSVENTYTSKSAFKNLGKNGTLNIKVLFVDCEVSRSSKSVRYGWLNKSDCSSTIVLYGNLNICVHCTI